MKHRKRKNRALPVIICLLALVLLLGLVFCAVRLIAQRPAGTKAASTGLVLDGGWNTLLLAEGAENSAGKAATEAKQAFIDATLEEAAALGCDTLYWQPYAARDALYRDKTKDGFSTAPAITENDTFFSKFDPLQYLARAADRKNMALVLLAGGDDTTLLTAAPGSALVGVSESLARQAKRYGLELAAPNTPDSYGVLTYTHTDHTGAPTGLLALRCDTSPARLTTALTAAPCDGVILGDYTVLSADPGAALLLAAWHTGTPQPDLTAYYYGKTVPQELALSYPSTVLYTDTCFLMGTSDPDLPLTIAGGTVGESPIAVERYGTEGVWGMLVSLAVGENSFTLSQPGGQSIPALVTRAETGGWTSAPVTSDGSTRAQAGQKLRITGTACASALTTPSSSDTIAQTLYEGATAEVVDSLRFVRNNKYTYAYQLASGDYVLAGSCTLLSDEPDAAFTGLSVQPDGEANCEVLTFAGSGSPVIYHSWEDNVLTLTFYSASYSGALPAADAFITHYELSEVEGGFSLRMTFAENDPLFGWHLGYEDGTTRLYLKHRPRLSEAESGPLTGVTVLLDPGHGDTDDGAMGAAGSSAPAEKDVNLALSWAARHRLEALGATVVMTREDDTFYTLSERLEMLNRLKPDYFIAVHHNSAALTSDLNANGGTECYWFYTEGKPLAQALADGVATAGARVPRGSLYDYFFVTRSNICPAVLLETGFMTVPGEYESCVAEDNLWAEGGAIAEAIYRCTANA